MLFVFAIPVLAVKPTNNLAGATTIPWNLSGAVMPLPWGQHDIIGSDVASKLIVNQPNGNTEVAITGVMKGLAPNTTYEVFPSNKWTTHQVWDISGDWVIAVNNGAYPHDYTFSMVSLPDGTFTGTGGYPAGGDYAIDEIVINGKITGNNVVFTAVYYNPTTNNPTGYSWTATGTIDNDGKMVVGTGTGGVYEWHSTSGVATKKDIGNGHPGLFIGQSTFTFTTDETGSGSWHLNLQNADFQDTGTYWLSIWVNQPGATILISDNFSVVVE